MVLTPLMTTLSLISTLPAEVISAEIVVVPPEPFTVRLPTLTAPPKLVLLAVIIKEVGSSLLPMVLEKTASWALTAREKAPETSPEKVTLSLTLVITEAAPRVTPLVKIILPPAIISAEVVRAPVLSAPKVTVPEFVWISPSAAIVAALVESMAMLPVVLIIGLLIVRVSPASIFTSPVPLSRAAPIMTAPV